MKKLIIVVFAIFCLWSCNYEAPPAPTSYNKLKYRVVVIDNCEYIMVQRSSGGYHGYGYMAHKGNCKYCAGR